MIVKEKKIKSVITKSNLPEADFVINPYVGCQHSCIYCYADFMKRFTGHTGENWGDFIDAKINAPDTIKKVKKDSMILFGSVTDPYQPIEAKYQITKKCLEKLLPFQPKIEIITKSPLILRDINLLKKFKNLKVIISIGIFDEKIARQLEPFAVSPKKRMNILKELNKQRIHTILFISPIFPEISNIGQLINSSKNFINEIFFENLNIRANNKKSIFNFLQKNNPQLISTYEKILKDNSYWNNLKEKITVKCEKEGIKYKMFFNH